MRDGLLAKPSRIDDDGDLIAKQFQHTSDRRLGEGRAWHLA